jgi:hypothetical protein
MTRLSLLRGCGRERERGEKKEKVFTRNVWGEDAIPLSFGAILSEPSNPLPISPLFPNSPMQMLDRSIQSR